MLTCSFYNNDLTLTLDYQSRKDTISKDETQESLQGIHQTIYSRKLDVNKHFKQAATHTKLHYKRIYFLIIPFLKYIPVSSR